MSRVRDDGSAERLSKVLATAGIAFCYITQISRYIENMKLPIRGIRLVQASPYGVTADGRGTAAPCDTHLFNHDRLAQLASGGCPVPAGS